MATTCLVYRCSKQQEMYLYVRVGLKTEDLPEALRRHAGTLTQVMELELSPQRKLARADTAKVLAKLEQDGYYLQLPPSGHINAHLYAGD